MSAKVNRILQALKQGRVSLGVNVQTNSPEIVEMVGLSGYDHVMIDWEHGSFGTDSVVSMIRAAEVTGVTPIVRIPSNSEVWIKRVLDAGALGVVVPHVSTKEKAEAAVQAARYRSQRGGSRGACPSVRAAGHLSSNWREFSEWSNENIFVALAIESPLGVANVEEILSVPGLDALFLGTFDLAHDMGYFGDNSAAEVDQQIQRLIGVSKSAGIPLHATLYRGTTPEETHAELERWKGAGAGVVNAVSDRRLVMESLRSKHEVLGT